jgi:hypothetical protein
MKVIKVEDNQVANRVKPQGAAQPGISPLTFEDTRSLAYLEGMVYQDNPSLIQGMPCTAHGAGAGGRNNVVTAIYF